MRNLIGLTVTATVLAGCGGSSSNSFVVEPDSIVTPTEVVDVPDIPEIEADTPDDTPVVAGGEFSTISPPVLSGLETTFDTTSEVAGVEIIVGDISSASFDNFAGTLAVQIALDGSEDPQPYVASGTVNGYSHFIMQDDPLDRQFKAFARETDDGQLQAIIVADGGQFNRFFGGGTIIQNSYSPIATGLASYAGDYVGLTNIGPALVTGNGADLSVVPETASEVTGTVFINADFVDGRVNGSIYDRVLDLDGVDVELQTIVLTVGDLETNGQFTGEVEFEDLTRVGDYNGAFGGGETPGIGGIVSLGDGFLEDARINGAETTIFDGIDAEVEYGLFVLDQCPAGGASCFDAN